MRTRKLVTLSAVAGLAMVLCLGVLEASADTNPSPWIGTYDTSDNPKTEFAPGETVRVRAHSTVTPYYVYILYEGAIVKAVGPIMTQDYVHDFTDITSHLGCWEAKVLNIVARWRAGWYHVIPEVPLGVATALTASFAGLGAFLATRKKP